MEAKVLKRNIAGSRQEIFEMRRESIRVTRDMAYKPIEPLHTHNVLGDIPAATLIASIWGMNVGGIPFSGSPKNGFWVVAGLIAAVFALVAIVLYRFRFKFF
jgi:hypothetical protein